MADRGGGFLDPAELARLDDLELLARTVVAGLGAGVHPGRHTGTSAEFARYRTYAQGDDARSVDWKLYGKTDRLHVKEFQEETHLSCTVLLDCSASMDYAGAPAPGASADPATGLTKFHYARMLAASIVLLAADQGDSVGFVAYHHELSAYLPPRSRPGWTHAVLVEIGRQLPAGSTDPETALHFAGEVLSPGLLVVVSDLLSPADALMRHLRLLRGRRHDVVVLQVSDRTELTFPFDRSVVLADAESGRERFTVPDEVRAAYLENRERHFDHIRAGCLAAEIDIGEFVTDEPLDRALHHFLHRRSRGIRSRSRRSTAFR